MELINCPKVYEAEFKYLQFSVANGGELLQLLAALPPGDQSRGLRSGALALHVVGAVRRDESILGEDVHGNGFHWKKSH